MNILYYILGYVSIFLSIYMMIYCAVILISAIIGTISLYIEYKKRILKNVFGLEEECIPISIISPAYNEEVTIIDSVINMLNLDYSIYEVIIIDDGSTDNTVKLMIEKFGMHKIDMPIKYKVPCKKAKEVYMANINNVDLFLVRKENGKKADASNLGINVAKYPYIIDTDTDSIIQKDCLKKLIIPVLMDDTTIACGGRISISNELEFRDGFVKKHKLPKHILAAIQVLEYERSFLSSRIFFDKFNGNLIISGALGLFNKNILLKVGGYRVDALGEDMDLVTRMHIYCKNNKIKYKMKYVADSVCWTQAPISLADLKSQRQRWFVGLYQVMKRYKSLFPKSIFYLYYFLFEFLSPFIETLGVFIITLSIIFKLTNINLLLITIILSMLFNAFATLASYYARAYIYKTNIEVKDAIKAIILCIFDAICWKPIHTFFRVTALFMNKNKKYAWKALKRNKHNIK